jgi:putative hydrolase of the HAD superfamily
VSKKIPYYKYLIFDLDDTLYPREVGLLDEINRRIVSYMVTSLGFTRDEAESARGKLCAQYGTTLRGLQATCDIDADHYLSFVHDIPIEQYLEPDPALDAMLRRIPLVKVILTNSELAHAERVLNRLGVAGHFSFIIDLRMMGFRGKPEPQAYDSTLQLLGAKGSECILVDDQAENLRPAKDLFGMTTVLAAGHDGPGVDFAIESVLELEALVICNLYSSRSRRKPLPLFDRGP